VHPRNLFQLRPAHFSERHSALLLVALGESVAAIGIGAGELVGRSGQENLRLVLEHRRGAAEHRPGEDGAGQGGGQRAAG
jgi:hypothetical protein